MEVTATLRYARITPRKMRLVGDLCKGLPVDKAHYQLDFCQKRGGKFLAVLLDSAIANAREKGGIDLDNLYVKQVTVNDGPILKRFMPRAMGRATKIQKKMSHITVVLDEAR
ncbi:MAG: 50S ribosomal protein L22 [Bdellovibrionales bacterium]|nr:50S ribosomal protein L22 [Pseudomonadota bacterium]MSP19048.1 50S ribosomal protein L22 [Bdellovibrionales bacterium]